MAAIPTFMFPPSRALGSAEPCVARCALAYSEHTAGTSPVDDGSSYDLRCRVSSLAGYSGFAAGDRRCTSPNVGTPRNRPEVGLATACSRAGRNREVSTLGISGWPTSPVAACTMPARHQIVVQGSGRRRHQAADRQQPMSVTTGEPARKPWRIMTPDPAIDSH